MILFSDIIVVYIIVCIMMIQLFRERLSKEAYASMYATVQLSRRMRHAYDKTRHAYDYTRTQLAYDDRLVRHEQFRRILKHVLKLYDMKLQTMLKYQSCFTHD